MKSSAALRALLAAVTVSILVAACAGAAAPSGPGGGSPAASPGGSGGGSDPGAGSGPDGSSEPIESAPADPGNGIVDPGQPQLVEPMPGQQNVHPVAIEEIDVRVEGRHAVLNARWWSGVEPCSVLDSVAWKRDGTTITISVREGSGGGDLVCIDLAVYKATIIDLGELDPGEYTVIADEGNAPPITFTIG